MLLLLQTIPVPIVATTRDVPFHPLARASERRSALVWFALIVNVKSAAKVPFEVKVWNHRVDAPEPVEVMVPPTPR